jgi:hypothetical protein
MSARRGDEIVLVTEAARKRAEVEAEAERRGACLVCLRKSDYNAPRFITHRRANFHGGVA